MDESIKYNLRNPAFSEDIGTAIVNRMYPGTVNNVTGMPDFNPNEVKINNGQPENDTYENQNSKDKQNLKKILIGVGSIAAVIFGVKKGKALFNFVKGLFKGKGHKNLGSKVTNKVKDLGKAATKSGSDLGSKLKDSVNIVAEKAKSLSSKGKNLFNKMINKLKSLKK